MKVKILKNNNMNELSYVSQIATTKEQSVNFAEGLKRQITNGEVDPLEAAKLLKALEEIVNYLRKDEDVNDIILAEAEKQNSKSFEMNGAKFQIKEVGVKYDFKACKDSEWEQLDAQEKSIKEQKKVRESFLKAIPQYKSVANTETGEEIFAPSKTSTTKLTVSIK
jgi:hypothetical protein